MTLRVPTGYMPNESLAVTPRVIAIGIGRARCAEELAPPRATVQPMRVLNRVSGLVPHDRHARRGVSTFHRMHLSTLESHESGVGEIEGNGESRNTRWRKPLFREPDVRTDAQGALLKLEQQLPMTAIYPCARLREAQVPKAQPKQALVAPPGPWGKLGSPAGHPHIQRSSRRQRNSGGAKR